MNGDRPVTSDETALGMAFDAVRHMRAGPHHDELEHALHNIQYGRHVRTSLLVAYLEVSHVESLFYRWELLDALNVIKHHLRPLKFAPMD